VTTTTRRRWPLAAAAVLALATAGAGTAIATGDDQTPATSAAGSTTAPYGYGPSAFTDCLDDRDVPYTQQDTAEGHELTPLGTDDPDIAAAIETCNQLTSRPITEDYTAYVNEITTVIVDCLRDKGYTINIDTDGNGVNLEWTTVPADLGETSQAFRDDLGACTSVAQMRIPSPAPTN
jgi:hypothetical protein